ncbi:branched-chain amino acid ABC transporter permease [Paraburkholderia aromaticivorans]|uniref:Branched-chain amino acid ABC transporter permease n=1 Tax=Paraburkholderia aromaticivorans TaxID=2026199 RepID=A0A248VYN5_9BURK|nr:branched-chain amino acid ABC transporter permease [Paraburkholderia aromaticivorans]ASW04149.1 hypothetical protein CJU94_38965 [Paraburkholderia aromaticivorans]
MTYLIAMGTQTGLFALLALSLNLQWGYTGLQNFGLVGFYAAGAYCYALTTTLLGWPTAAGILAAMAVGTLLAYPLGLASIRLRIGFYLAIVTLGFSETIRAVLVNEDWLTQGTRGIAVKLLFPGWGAAGNQTAMFGLILVAVIAVYLLFERVGQTPFGRTIEAIRDNEDAARSLGKPVTGFKIQVFMLGSAVTAGAGALNAIYVGYLVPDQFLSIITFYVWMAMIVGGSGSNRGVVLGCLVLVLLLEGSRFLKEVLPAALLFSDQRMAALRLMIIGLGLTVIPINWPRGLLGRKEL